VSSVQNDVNIMAKHKHNWNFSRIKDINYLAGGNDLTCQCAQPLENVLAVTLRPLRRPELSHGGGSSSGGKPEIKLLNSAKLASRVYSAARVQILGTLAMRSPDSIVLPSPDTSSCWRFRCDGIIGVRQLEEARDHNIERYSTIWL